jgi:Diacylglycerol kinase catalytic domain
MTRTCPPSSPTRLRRGADALGVAGGDGSLAPVAAAAAASGLPFVCVPAGTRNHFAADLGVDRRDLVGALDAFGEGVERRIDIATVNGRMFLNNVSLGIYGHAVRRPGYRDAKLRTLVSTAAEVRGPSAEASDVRLTDDLGHEHRDPAVVLVSNSPYALEPPGAPSSRAALDHGVLGVLVLDAPEGASPPRGHAWSTPALTVAPPGRRTRVSTASRSTWLRRSSSRSGRLRCSSGSPHGTTSPPVAFRGSPPGATR